MFDSGLQHMCVNENGKHAQRFVMFYEAHATHICGEIVDVLSAFGGRLAVFLQVQVERQVLDVVEAAVPLLQGFDINSPKGSVALLAKCCDEVAADEPSRPCDDYCFVL